MDDERIEHALKLGPRRRAGLPRRGARPGSRTSAEVPVGASTQASADAEPALDGPDADRSSDRADRAPDVRRSSPRHVRPAGSRHRRRGRRGGRRPAGTGRQPHCTGDDLLARLQSAGAVSVAVPDAPPQPWRSGAERHRLRHRCRPGTGRGAAVGARRVRRRSRGVRRRLVEPRPGSRQGSSTSRDVVASQPYGVRRLHGWPSPPARRLGPWRRLDGQRVCVIAGSSGARPAPGCPGRVGEPDRLGSPSSSGRIDDACIVAWRMERRTHSSPAWCSRTSSHLAGSRPCREVPCSSSRRVVLIRGSAADTATTVAAVNRGARRPPGVRAPRGPVAAVLRRPRRHGAEPVSGVDRCRSARRPLALVVSLLAVAACGPGRRTHHVGRSGIGTLGVDGSRRRAAFEPRRDHVQGREHQDRRDARTGARGPSRGALGARAPRSIRYPARSSSTARSSWRRRAVISSGSTRPRTWTCSGGSCRPASLRPPRSTTARTTS